MVLTVRKVLKIGPLKKARIVAGHQGLDNEITFVNIMEVPEVARWMKGGEFLVTAGLPLKNDPLLRKRIIEELHGKGVSAFGIKPGQFFDTIPDDLIVHADKVGLPLIELPSDIPYMDFMLPIFETLINNQLFMLKKAEEIHNTLIEVALKGNGIPELCEKISDLIGNPSFIFDKSNNILGYSGMNEEDCIDLVQKTLKQITCRENFALFLRPHRSHRVKVELHEIDKDLLVVPVDINGIVKGYLAIGEFYRELDEQDVMAIERASTIISLELMKEQAVFEAERKVRGELLEDLINGNFRYEEAVVRRASFLNFNLNCLLAIFVINTDGFEQFLQNSIRKDEMFAQEVKSYISDITHHVFLDYRGTAMLLSKSDGIIGLINLNSSQDKRVLLNKIELIRTKILEKYKRLTISVGVGRAYQGARYIKQSYEEALTAVHIGRMIKGGASTTFFEDLGPYRFLYEMKDSISMQNYCQDVLGDLLAYDKHNNTELVKTLYYYFRNNCNLRLTSESLYIHKNSVIYRMKKIEELTGLSMDKAEDRFNLQLALTVGQVVNRDIFGEQSQESEKYKNLPQFLDQ